MWAFFLDLIHAAVLLAPIFALSFAAAVPMGGLIALLAWWLWRPRGGYRRHVQTASAGTVTIITVSGVGKE